MTSDYWRLIQGYVNRIRALFHVRSLNRYQDYLRHYCAANEPRQSDKKLFHSRGEFKSLESC
jgi:hypothetical protein